MSAFSNDVMNIVRILLGDGWHVEQVKGEIVCRRDIPRGYWRDHEPLQSVAVTYDLLAKLADACGTKLIDIGSSHEAGFPGSEVTGSEADSFQTMIRIRP